MAQKYDIKYKVADGYMNTVGTFDPWSILTTFGVLKRDPKQM